jgi:tRNA A22 N-methylase
MAGAPIAWDCASDHAFLSRKCLINERNSHWVRDDPDQSASFASLDAPGAASYHA